MSAHMTYAVEVTYPIKRLVFVKAEPCEDIAGVAQDPDNWASMTPPTRDKSAQISVLEIAPVDRGAP